MDGQVNAGLLVERADKLFFYSPYNFLRRLDAQIQQRLFGTGRAEQFVANPTHRLFEVSIEGYHVQFLYSLLDWDTKFFRAPVYKLFTALFTEDTPPAVLAASSKAFRQKLKLHEASYCFVELPAEDTALAQALGAASWRLVETRLTYFHDNVSTFNEVRYAVRSARPDEAVAIGRISAMARNVYDRFHADLWFGNGVGDEFLASYAMAAVQGYCDTVLVPDEPGVKLDSFLAVSDLLEHAQELSAGLSRVVLTAVGPANRGWHRKLVAEVLQRARLNGTEYVLMTTQATNRAVFRTCEKLNFKVGACSHILACSEFN